MTKFARGAFLAVLFPALLCLSVVNGSGVEAQASGESESAEPFRISVNLNLVVLPATVRDRKGGFAGDLRKEDFEVYEDGTRQEIRLFRHEDIPVTVGLVVDHSGSMQKKLPDVLSAAQAFVQLSNEQDQMFVVNFNERVSLGLPFDMPFTHIVGDMNSAILISPISGETALYDALDLALNHLRQGDREKKVLIAISDGGDNASKTMLPQVLKKAEEANAIIYTIGIFDSNDPDQNASVLRRMAKETGGEAFFPAEFKDAIGVCQEIAKDIRHQYALGYVSNSTKPAGRRSIRVVAHAPGRDLVVRTRAEYFAEAASK